MKHELGINTNCECGKTLKETLENIKVAGFRNIMLSSKCGEIDVGLKLAKELKLKVPYVHLPYRPPYGVSMINIWKHGVENEATIDYFVDKIKLCEKYGVQVAVMHTVNGLPQLENEINLQVGIESIRKILDATKDCAVKLAFENHSAAHNKYLKVLLDNIKDDRLGLCYDSGHHYLLTPDTNFLKDYGDRLFALHLQDNLMDAPDLNRFDRDLHLMPFDGKIDFEKVMHNIAKTRFSGIIMLELHRQVVCSATPFYDMPPIDFLREAYRRAEKLAKMLDETRSKLEK